MKQVIATLVLVFCAVTGSLADTVNVGIIGPMSGADASNGRAWRTTIEAYQKTYGESVDGHRVNFIYRDVPVLDPAQAKNLAQELVSQYHVQYLGGIFYTPEARAIAPLVQETQTPTVIFNAATSSLLALSDFMLRVSYTLSQVATPIADYAVEEGDVTAVTLVADYVSGVASEDAFATRFEAGGRRVLARIHVPLSTTDYGPLMQKIRVLNPDALFVFLPSGADSLNIIKAFNDNGLKRSALHFLGTSQTDETVLPLLGDQALGLVTGHFYSPTHVSAENAALVAMLRDQDPGAVVTASHAVAYDGVSLIYRMIHATGGAKDGPKAIAAVLGSSWMSPRGPVRIDAVSRQLIQNIYMRRVERGADGTLVNREFKTFAMQPADYAPPSAALAVPAMKRDLRTTFGGIAIDGVSYAMVLFMISIGLALTEGLMRVINLSHGCFAMVGGYGCAWCAQHLGTGFIASLLLALLVAGLISWPIERLLLRRYYQRPRLDQVLVTLGLIYLFIATADLLFGANMTVVVLPRALSGTVNLGFRVLPRQRLAVVGLGILVALSLWAAIERTSFGMRLRAAADNHGMAEAIGIDTRLIYAAAFALGAVLGALGGIAGAEIMPMEPTYPSKYLLPILAVVAVGGHGRLVGSFLAALLLGLVETTVRYVMPDMASIAFYSVMFALLLVRPRGLFEQAH